MKISRKQFEEFPAAAFVLGCGAGGGTFNYYGWGLLLNVLPPYLQVSPGFLGLLGGLAGISAGCWFICRVEISDDE